MVEDDENTLKNDQAKSKTIEELKAFEAKKADADHSLRKKLESFSEQLPLEERSILSELLSAVTAQPMDVEANRIMSVFLKPMQAHTGTEVSVFLKPMQVHVDSEVSVFLKPMQIQTGPDVSVFLKPMQSPPSEEVFLKPMQAHSPVSPTQDIPTKPD